MPKRPATILKPVLVILTRSVDPPNISSTQLDSGPVSLPRVLLNTSSNKFGILPFTVFVSFASLICSSVFSVLPISRPLSIISFKRAAYSGNALVDAVTILEFFVRLLIPSVIFLAAPIAAIMVLS